MNTEFICNGKLMIPVYRKENVSVYAFWKLHKQYFFVIVNKRIL